MPFGQGGCLCGAIRYFTHSEPLFAAVCHCRHCQRQTGSAFSVVAGFPDDAIEVRGVPRIFKDVGESGKTVARHFCGECGSPIISVLEALPGTIIVKAGTLDEFGVVSPTIEVFCDSAVSFVQAINGAVRYPRSNLEHVE
jgi:hypothetical protein